MTQVLLPQPKELSLLDGTFSLDAETLIVIPAQASDNGLFALLEVPRV